MTNLSKDQVCPVLTAFCGAAVDSWLFKECTDELTPYAAKIATAKTLKKFPNKLATRRAYIAANHAVKVFTPFWLRWFKKFEQAIACELMPKCNSEESARKVIKVIYMIRRTCSYSAPAYAADSAQYSMCCASTSNESDAAIYAIKSANLVSVETGDGGGGYFPYRPDTAELGRLRSMVIDCLDEMIKVK